MCGATLVEQDGATRTTGCGLGQRRAGARARAEVRETRDRPRGRDRDRRIRRRFQESLNAMRNRGFQSGEGGQLRGQAAVGLRAGPWPSSRKEHRKRLRTDKSTRHKEDTVQEGKSRDARRRAPDRGYDSGSRESGRAASGQQAQIWRALRFPISRVMLA